ncbi:MAG TPA: hypothetical protein VH744_13295, partial [Terriglobales bacterium]
ESGAYACALAATELARGYVAVGRAETRTGADYYIALSGQIIEDLEDCLRLEVSGTDSEVSVVKTRLKGKCGPHADRRVFLRKRIVELY